MADGSAEENIQFSLEAIDLDEDIEMADELICNKGVEEDCVLSEEEISIFEIAKEETSVFLQLLLSTKKILLVWLWRIK